jgi:hypothetical protein
MTDATDLWAAVEAHYNAQDLLNLTNLHDPTAITADDTVGVEVSQSVIDLWPAYAQVAYDSSDALHVEVAMMGVIAKLWERGGTAVSIAKMKWDEVFTDGVIQRLKMTGPRAHAGPSSNSEVTSSSELRSDGTRNRPWSDPKALPIGILPMGRGVDD